MQDKPKVHFRMKFFFPHKLYILMWSKNTTWCDRIFFSDQVNLKTDHEYYMVYKT